MREAVLSFEDESLLREKLHAAARKLAVAGFLGVVFFLVLTIIPLKYFPFFREGFFANGLLAGYEELIFLLPAMLSGSIWLGVFFGRSRYLALMKDIDQKTKMVGSAGITAISRRHGKAGGRVFRTTFETSLQLKRYRRLYWLEEQAVPVQEGEEVIFECGKYSGILLKITKI